MRKTLLTLSLLSVLAPLAQAQQTKAWGNLQVTLESCFRASSGTDSGCNVVITNRGPQPVRVQLAYDSEVVTLPDNSVVRPKELIFGGAAETYRVTQIIPTGVSLRAQLNYNLTKGVNTVKALRIGDAEFLNVPLRGELPDEPAVNAPGTPVTSDQSEQVKMTLLDCLRDKGNVTCSFAMTSLVDESLRVKSSSYDDTWLVTRRGLVRNGSAVNLGGDNERYTANSVMPARRSVLSQLTFPLPEADTFVPYLQLNNYVFKNLPITAQAGPRLLNPATGPVLTYRLRDYAGKVDKCAYVREGLRCDFVLTNRTEQGYRLEVSYENNMFLDPTGVWYGTRSLSSGGDTQQYRVGVPMPAGQDGMVSVLYNAPAGLTNIPYLRMAGLEFENIPVR